MGLLEDILAAAVPGNLSVHLGDTSPVLPYKLSTLVDATFAGYTPAIAVITSRNSLPNGWVNVECNATFQNLSDVPVTIMAAWLVGSAAGQNQLLSVLQAPAFPKAVSLRPLFTLYFVFKIYEIPG